MTGMDATDFHKIRSLQGVLTSKIKGYAPRHTRLPLQEILMPALMEIAHRADSPQDDPRQALQEISADLEQWQRFLGELQDTVNRWYIFQSREWTFSPGWWQEEFSELHAAFLADPGQGVRRWLDTFTRALVEWDLPGCKALVEQSFPFPDYLSYLPLMFEGSLEGLMQGNYAEAEDMLAFLTKPGGIDPNQPTLEPLLHALVLVLRGRIEALQEDPQGVQEYFQQAIDLAPQDGRPLAAMGEHHRILGELDQATSLFNEAVRLSPEQPEGYTGMAMVMEDQGYWEEAHAWYSQAVDCALRFPDPYRTLERMLAPVSGNLYYHLALAFQDISERQALPAIDKSLELGMNGSLSYPEVDAYALKGKLLRKLRKKPEAALAFYEAGRRSGWNLDYKQAVELLRTAQKLNPSHQPTYWYLSDDLRMLAVAAQELPEKDVLVRESLKVWEEGAALGEINPDNSWTLFTRALINEIIPQRRSTAPEEMVLYDWEGVMFIERNLLFSDDKSFQWSYLARFYRSLNLDVNNDYVLKRALELDPGETTARDELIIRLTNRGDYQEAVELIKPLLDDESYTDAAWLRSVYGYILTRLGQPEEGIRLSQDNLKEYWVKLYRALCYMKLNQPDLAKEIYTEIWDSRLEDNQGNLLYYTIAGLHLALLDAQYQPALDQVIQYARRIQNSPNDPYESYFNLGLALLAKGEDIPQAQFILEDTALKATTRRELTDSINEVLPVMRPLMSALPHGEQALAILDEVSRKMQARLDEVYKSSPTAEDELLAGLEWLETSPHTGMPDDLVTNARLGARLSLARLYLNAARWSEAAQAYHALLAYENRIPEARLGLEKALQNMQQAAQEHLSRDEFEAALPLMESRAEFARHLGMEQELPEIQCQLFYAHLSLAGNQPDTSLPQAAALLQDAAGQYQAQGREDVWSAISGCLRKTLTSVEDYWRVDQALGLLLARLTGEDAALLAGVQELRQSLDDYLGEIYRLESPYIGIPATNRIAIELGSALLPQGASQDWDLMRWINLDRWTIWNLYGLEIPGVHIRLESEVLAPDEYRILIDGQQVDRRRRVEHIGTDLSIYRSFSQAILLNIARFINLRAASDILRNWQKVNATCFLVANRLMQDSASLLAFKKILQALASERVPTNYPDEILTALVDVPLALANLPETIARLRMVLQKVLPGNTRQAKRIALPEGLETRLKSYLQTQNGEPCLALPDAEVERFLSVFRNLAEEVTEAESQPGEGEQPRTPVLVCQDANLRPLLRRLIAADLPDLPVLSAQEVITEFPPEEKPASPEESAQDAAGEAHGGD